MILLEKVGEEEDRHGKARKLFYRMMGKESEAESRAAEVDGNLKAYYLGQRDAYDNASREVAEALLKEED